LENNLFLTEHKHLLEEFLLQICIFEHMNYTAVILGPCSENPMEKEGVYLWKLPLNVTQCSAYSTSDLVGCAFKKIGLRRIGLDVIALRKVILAGGRAAAGLYFGSVVDIGVVGRRLITSQFFVPLKRGRLRELYRRTLQIGVMKGRIRM
jgi:hypothetical protein